MTGWRDDVTVGASAGASLPGADPREGIAWLVGLLDLEQLETDIFRGQSHPSPSMRVFGGQVAAQALVAAGRTVAADRQVHSLHSYFLRPGDFRAPIVYLVERLRDGRSFVTRRVNAVQHGQTIFSLSASFQADQPGLEHQDPMPDVPAPERLSGDDPGSVPYGVGEDSVPAWRRLFDQRVVPTPPPGSPREAVAMQWIRTVAPLPDDRLLHVCALTYASDLSLLGSALLPHGIRPMPGAGRLVAMASLDHAMWFHRPFRMDDWLLYVQHSPSASGSRGLGEGRFFDRRGRLVVSVIQEGLLRVSPDPS